MLAPGRRPHSAIYDATRMTVPPSIRALVKLATLLVAGVGVLSASLTLAMLTTVLLGSHDFGWLLFPFITLLLIAVWILLLKRLAWRWRAIAGLLLLAGSFMLLPRPTCATTSTPQAGC